MVVGVGGGGSQRSPAEHKQRVMDGGVSVRYSHVIRGRGSQSLCGEIRRVIMAFW